MKRTSLDEHKTKLARITLGHEGDPGDVTGALIHLMSDEANYTTG